jgi:hypothetical protein
MLASLHTLKKSEEGQTLVLAAVFGLVLMLCVLGTVNLGRAVYDKVQLQAAADSAAYSEAAMEARVMNFTAYANRAMVVHYASIMAQTAYLTWLHFEWGVIRPILNLLKYVPYIGSVATAIDTVLHAVMVAIDVAVAILVPVLSLANLMLWGLEEGAWLSVWARLGTSMPAQGHSGDSASHPYLPIWPNLIPQMNQVVFSQTRGVSAVPMAALDAAKMLINSKDQNVQLARLHMLEIANSARQPWVAYGDGYPTPSVSPLARHFEWGPIPLIKAAAGNVARTELGTFEPKGGILGLKNAQPQVWSGTKFQAWANWDFKIFHLHIRLSLFWFVALDSLLPMKGPNNKNVYSYFDIWHPNWWQKILVNAIVPMLLPALNQGVQWANNNAKPSPDFRAYVFSPYVYYAAHAGTKQKVGPAGANGNFAQPDVLVGLAKEGRDYNAERGAARYYGHRFTWHGGGAGTGTTDFSYTNADWPTIPGLPRQVLHKGLNAFSAAQVYYHRPGDWKEQPNFFNPLWGARLMPVMESNVFQRLGLGKVPLFKDLLTH